ncbi:MAG: YvcK family protein [Anaerolineae bacterium]|nr:YvcK family protein [Anaerolineae bacterium]
MGHKVGSAQKWLYPGLGVKRWLALLLLGIAFLSLGIAYLLHDLHTSGWISLSTWQMLTLAFLPGWARSLGAVFVGLSLAAIAIYQFNHALLGAFMPSGNVSVVDTLYRHRLRRRGAKVVAIGGGNGLNTLLRGLKHYTDNITAIVTVADDGGSSGRLRRELGVLPPGDFRNCITALADDEALITQLFQYRFPARSGGNDSGALDGHSFGNLFITAMTGVTGSFEKALTESGRVLAIRGQIVPSTLEDVTLCAELVDDMSGNRIVLGESAIPEARRPIGRVYLQPDNVPAYPPAVRAILEADLIVAGPGSLFTSVLPNLLIEDIVRAIRASTALKVYVCNVATQAGETEGFEVADHVAALERHTGPKLFPYVLVNNHLVENPPSDWNFQQVVLRKPLGTGYRVIAADVVDEQRPWRHHPEKLARVLMSWYAKQARELGGDDSIPQEL